jgi:CheY-like chemotaxis protein
MTQVLVVDDEQAMADVMAEELRGRQLEVTILSSADAAFAKVMEGDVDVVLTDLNMRGMSGVELCDRVVTNRPDVPVIVVTAFGSMDTAVVTLRAGAFDFLTKPFEMVRSSSRRARRAAQAPSRRGEAAARGGRGIETLRGARRDEPRDEGPLCTPRPGRRDGRNGAHHRRDGHRERARRPRHSPAESQCGRADGDRQLRGDPGQLARERALRPRARRIHRRAL